VSICPRHKIKRDIVPCGRGKSYEQCPECLKEDQEEFRKLPFTKLPEKGK
jgi:hypothetical protein